MPYIMDLKKNFTQYALTDLMDLSSKYSMIIYRWLSMHYSQYEYYQSHGGRSEAQLEKLKNPVISVDELRRLTDTTDEYARMSTFTKWILQKPCEEISQNTHLQVEFEKIKEGRAVKNIRFIVTAKHIARLPRKTGELDAKRQKSLRKADSAIYADAMQSPYTEMLTKTGMLTPQDLINQELMIYLQENVYPQYDELKKLNNGGVAGDHKVQEHMRYVSQHWRPSDTGRKNNKARYLDVSIAGYLNRMKI